MPTFIAKMMASVQIMNVIEEFQSKVESIQGGTRAADWNREIERIQGSLAAAMKALDDIDNELPPDQGRAQIQKVFRGLKPVHESIERLGIVISKVQH
jgi:hypothetical protein